MAGDRGDRAPRRQGLRRGTRRRAPGSPGVGGHARGDAEQRPSPVGGGGDGRGIGKELGQAAQEIEKERRESRIPGEGEDFARSWLAREQDQTRRVAADRASVEIAPQRLDRAGRRPRRGRRAPDAVYARTLSRKTSVEPPRSTAISFSIRRDDGVPAAADAVLAFRARTALLGDQTREHVIEAEGVAEDAAAARENALDLRRPPPRCRARTEKYPKLVKKLTTEAKAPSENGSEPHVAAHEARARPCARGRARAAARNSRGRSARRRARGRTGCAGRRRSTGRASGSGGPRERSMANAASRRAESRSRCGYRSRYSSPNHDSHQVMRGAL